MLPTQETIDHLAGRIERAFRRRCIAWNRGCSSHRIWSAAAVNLWRAHQENPDIPIDAELFVASQPIREMYSDPWADLAQVEAVHRYCRRIRKIIRMLQAELAREVAHAERMVAKGVELSRIVSASKRRLSPLGCYIVALRAGRHDLAGEYHERAVEQHRSCPLYRAACSAFLPEGSYPDGDRMVRRELSILSNSFGVCDVLMN